MAYSKTTWVDDSTALSAANLNHLEAGVEATATVADAAIPKSTVTTAGDLIYASGNATVARLAIGAATKFLAGGASAPSWVTPPGYEFNYTAFTSNVSVTATAEASAATVVTASAVTFDGSTDVIVEFFTPSLQKGTSNIALWLFQDGSSIGRLDFSQSAANSSLTRRRLTPASGSRTYSVRATVDAGTGFVSAGTGGSGSYVPGFIRITKA